jgi:hypothetical protein
MQTHQRQTTPRTTTARLTWPSKQSAPAPLGQNSASLEGPGAVTPKLRLARGLDAPSGETPPRSRAGRPLGRDSASLEVYAHPRVGLRLARGSRGSAATGPWRRAHSPDRSIKCSGTPRAPESKANPHHAGPLTPPGNHIPALFRQPYSRGHLRHFTALCGKASVNSVTLYHPLSYGRCAAPLKEDGGILEKGTDIYPAPTQDKAVTSDKWSASPPSPPALCGHPRRCVTIPGTAAPSPALWEPGTTRHRHARCCAPYDLLSAAPSSQRTDSDQTGSPRTATLEAAPGREQDLP